VWKYLEHNAVYKRQSVAISIDFPEERVALQNQALVGSERYYPVRPKPDHLRRVRAGTEGLAECLSSVNVLPFVFRNQVDTPDSDQAFSVRTQQAKSYSVLSFRFIFWQRAVGLNEQAT